MDVDRIREVAIEEVDAAFVRFLARVGEAVGTHEVFAWATAGWVHAWTASYLLPDEPVDPDDERKLREEVERARRDLELREPRDESEGA